MNKIAYLIEPTSVTTTGVIKGSSLRTYEVEYWTEPVTSYYTRHKVKSTGRVFTIKDGKIQIKKTKATLNSKWLRNGTPTSRIEDMPYYGCRLYTTPELALLSKSIAIKSRAQRLVTDLEKQLQIANQTLASIPDTSEFTSQYPEYLV